MNNAINISVDATKLSPERMSENPVQFMADVLSQKFLWGTNLENSPPQAPVFAYVSQKLGLSEEKLTAIQNVGGTTSLDFSGTQAFMQSPPESVKRTLRAMGSLDSFKEQVFKKVRKYFQPDDDDVNFHPLETREWAIAKVATELFFNHPDYSMDVLAIESHDHYSDKETVVNLFPVLISLSQEEITDILNNMTEWDEPGTMSIGENEARAILSHMQEDTSLMGLNQARRLGNNEGYQLTSFFIDDIDTLKKVIERYHGFVIQDLKPEIHRIIFGEDKPKTPSIDE